MHADWQCWPHHDELFFDIFVTLAVTEFRDHRHKQWFKTCCFKSPRHLVCGLRRVRVPFVLHGVPASLGHQRLQSALAAVVCSHNAPIVLKIDKNLAEKQKTTRARKNGGTPTANHGVTASEESEGNEEDKTAQNKSKNENIGGDTYYPGNIAVLSSFRDVDRRKAMEFHFKIFDDLRLKAAVFPFQDFGRSSRRGRATTTNDESDGNEDDNTQKSA
ncbi:hypothetical protein B0A54_09097 [Friedmanniomyces endolithicus]|uniref:Uncharacterized protein n=1 Tax=Friedmanniomyces endolithicus TaxID=329885 RepID=A0A4U0UZ81_9PEZI|nr:hypothetical protein B0A54_09097 [Friedmanniomyces endolithicus]